MPIYYGGTQINNINVGGHSIGTAYYGSTLVFQKVRPQPTIADYIMMTNGKNIYCFLPTLKQYFAVENPEKYITKQTFGSSTYDVYAIPDLYKIEDVGYFVMNKRDESKAQASFSYTTDGVTWIKVNVPTSVYQVQHVAFYNGVYTLIGVSSANQKMGIVLSSTNLSSWTTVNSRVEINSWVQEGTTVNTKVNPTTYTHTQKTVGAAWSHKGKLFFNGGASKTTTSNSSIPRTSITVGRHGGGDSVYLDTGNLRTYMSTDGGLTWVDLGRDIFSTEIRCTDDYFYSMTPSLAKYNRYNLTTGVYETINMGGETFTSVSSTLSYNKPSSNSCQFMVRDSDTWVFRCGFKTTKTLKSGAWVITNTSYIYLSRDNGFTNGQLPTNASLETGCPCTYCTNNAAYIVKTVSWDTRIDGGSGIVYMLKDSSIFKANFDASLSFSGNPGVMMGHVN